ncbi:MAG: Mur ligase family protein [Pseudomonadota bacterium]
MPVEPLPFEDSRRLTGPNPYFGAAGAALETLGSQARDATAVAAWRARVEAMCARLGWSAPRIVARAHAGGHSLAFTAPEDQLLAATEVNEWAWCAAIGDRRHHAPGHPLADDDARAFDTLARFAAAERRPALTTLLDAAAAHRAPALLDDEALTLGLGRHAHTWPLDALPSPETVDWAACGRIPTALVTGSNGKTTTVRLIAAMLRGQGFRTAHSCTDGLFVGGTAALERLQSGDYSGPAGARQLLRRNDVEAAVLETARGGLLRRGLALASADVAVVTNISADHFGEYGVHSVEDLAAVKLAVARAVSGEAAEGWLVLNAEDPLLRAQGPQAAPRIAWFAVDDSVLPTATSPRCALRAGRLSLDDGVEAFDLGAVADMPLTFGGRARHNIANIAAAALAAKLMGVPASTIRAVLAGFGRSHDDNPGRLQHWAFAGIEIFLDYAHNPDGMAALLEIANARRAGGRLALLLGQAGNREDAQIRELAATAARFAPDLVVVKDIDGYLRGREAGEVAQVIRDELLRAGMPASALPVRLREADAAREALAWARAGDVLVLPVHSLDAKAEVAALLDALQAGDWRPGRPLPLESPRDALRSSAPSDGAASV